MEMKKGLICSRNETPDSCYLCEQEGSDYCMKCADACTLEELQSTTNYSGVTPYERKVLLSDCFTGTEVTVPYFNHLV
jgi:hypothetical protein